MNWQIALGFFLLFGSFGAITSGPGPFLVGLLLSIGLIAFGMSKSKFWRSMFSDSEDGAGESASDSKRSKRSFYTRDGSPSPALKISSRSPSKRYIRSYYYDEVKFYPPEDIIADVPQDVLRPSSLVLLMREPKNEYDPNAVAIYVGGYKVGYILRGTLQDMIHEYDEKGWAVEASFISLKKYHGEHQGYISLSFYKNFEDIPLEHRRLGYNDIDIKSITPSDPKNMPSTSLTGKNVVFCGYFDLPLQDMMQKAVDAGATLRKVVTKTVDYLVVGKTDDAFLDENGLSSKEATATKLNAAGAKIEVISEEVFLYLISHPLEK